MILGLIFITMILLIFVEFGFLLSFTHPEIVSKYFRLSQKNKLPKIILGISMPIFVLVLYLLLKQLNTPQPNPNYVVQTQKILQYITSNEYKELNTEDFKTEDNYSFLYTGIDKSKAALEKRAYEIKNRLCKKTCTIYFYDDLKAYNLDRTRSTINSDQIMQEWNKNNYTYVADHFLGYLDSSQNAVFTYYPYKDWFYFKQEAKNTKL